MMKKLSLRWRLTLWNASVLIVVLGMISVGLYAVMGNKLEAHVDAQLDDGYGTVETVLRNSGGDAANVRHLGQGMMFRLNQRGALAYQTEAWKTAPWVPVFSEVSFSGASGSWHSSEGRHFRFKKGGIPEYDMEILFAADATDRLASLRSLAAILIAAIPLALVMSLQGGYFLAGRAVSHIGALSWKAREITAERLSERLTVHNPDDEIGRLATAFNGMLSRLEDSFKRLRRFTADASHELRTPLTAMRSVGELALRGPEDVSVCREAIASMLEEVHVLTQLTDHLLVLARGDARAATIAPRPMDLNALVGGVVDELGILAEDRNQALSATFAAPVSGIADGPTLRQAISNVLHNSIRYTPKNGRIEIRTSATTDGRAVIDILDDGPGIPAAERERVFERFYRLDKARSRDDGGTGLGLAIARWAVETNEGTILFLDKQGPGAHCRITLPSA